MALSFRTRIAYGLGDFGQNILFQVASIYLLSYYTDTLGLEAAFAGTLFLLARIWDGLNDPLFGWLAQGTRSRLGVYRPWLLWMAIPLALSFVAIFWVPLETGRYLWVVVSYLLFGMCFTAVNIPYGSLTAVLTADYAERGTLTGYRMTFGMLGGVCASFAFVPALAWLGGGTAAYTQIAIALALILLLSLGITFWGVKEQKAVGPIAPPDWRAMRRFLPKNRPFWLLCLVFGACFAAWASFAATAPYYYTYVVGDAAGVSWVFLIVMGVSTLSIPLWTRLSRRLEKRGVFLWGAMLYSLAFAGVYLLGVEQRWMGYALFALQGLGNGAAVYTSWAMIPDTIEYGQWQSGQRLESVWYGVYGVFLKVGLGLGAAIIGYGLSWSGYEAGVVGDETVRETMRALFSLLPLGAVLVAAGAMYVYPLSAARHAAIRAELAQRRKNDPI